MAKQKIGVNNMNIIKKNDRAPPKIKARTETP